MTRSNPFFISQAVGFDSLHKLLDSAATAAANQGAKTFPPYNVIKIDEDRYRIELALAGFGEDDLTIETEGDRLRISASPASSDDNVAYYHRGIALRAFSKEFLMAPYIKVDSASLVNGLLAIDLVRETPEALKPQTVRISSGRTAPTLGDQEDGNAAG